MDESRYSIHNEGTIQGQVIGDHNTIHQHYDNREVNVQPSSAALGAWNVPYSRNPLFTGREKLLTHLHENLTTSKAAILTQPQAISGLGGIGKTQIAVEYAYRFRNEYRSILWASAASSDALLLDFVAIASVLELPEYQAQDQNITVTAVKRWLATHEKWLLILDNADELEVINDFLPTGATGHILITTRAQATGTLAYALEVQEMDQQEGMLLLLRRAKVLAPDAPLHQAPEEDQAKAKAIVLAMDGLPLALDQAGAYIEETRCTVASYLEQYQRRQLNLLKRRGTSGTEHREPVATTWSLSFEKVEQLNPMAADLLRLCAFLSPDAIPLEMIAAGARYLGPALRPIAKDLSLLDEPIAVLRRYSLVRRDPNDNILSLHRLVQVIVKASLKSKTQRQWAQRTIQGVNEAFPFVNMETWPQCKRYLPHALACATLIKHSLLALPEAVQLLNQAGYYLQDHAFYEQAEPLYQQALAITQKVLDPDHPDTAASLNNLAMLYYNQGKYEQAEPLLEQAQAIWQKALGPDHPNTATNLNNLALLYQNQGKYEQAEPLLEQTLAIRQETLGPDHPDTAVSLNNLAMLYHDQGKYEQAEPLYQQALAIKQKALGPDHPDTARSLNNLALLYRDQGKYEQAEPLLEQALAITLKALGPDHPNTATSLNNLAMLYQNQGKYEQAEPLLEQAQAIRLKTLGPDHPNTAQSLNNLALLYQNQGKYEQAEPLYQQALAITLKTLGPDHPSTMTIQKNYTALLEQRKQEGKGQN
ncbi:MAG: tetratricopeptide repeat protein [Ktedonobacteraceae bacterium]